MPPIRSDLAASVSIAPVTPAADSARPRMAAEASSAATRPSVAMTWPARPSPAASWARSALSRAVLGGALGRLADELDLLDLDVGALGDLADRGGDLLDRAAGLVGGAGHLARGVGDAGGGAGDAAHDPAQVGDQAVERDAEQVLVRARRDPTVRSPSATASAAVAFSRRYSTVLPNDAAMRPTSSLDLKSS